jgi:putative methionine-R-sulfoxide reductase with GAF domain
MDAPARHLRLLTETIAAVNSTLDLEEVLALVARKVAEALGTEACFVYLYDETTDELVLRATHGTAVEAMTRRPRMRPGEGITGTAAAERAPIMIPAQAHLDPRFKGFPNLPEDQYESILAVPILAREKLAGALNVRTIAPRKFTQDEIDLLLALADQVAQTIEHAKLYSEAQRRVAELEALARISEAVSESLYLEESLDAIVATTVDAVGATGAALVLEDGKIAWPEGRAGVHAVRLPLRWKGRQIGELVCSMARRVSRACSGRLSRTCAVTPDWTLMMAMACATVSWTSRAILSRSSSTRARASSSRVRSANSARCNASAAMNLLERTLSPRAALMTDAPIRKNTQPMAAGGSMSVAAISQTAARAAIPTPAITSERRPSPSAVSV